MGVDEQTIARARAKREQLAASLDEAWVLGQVEWDENDTLVPAPERSFAG